MSTHFLFFFHLYQTIDIKLYSCSNKKHPKSRKFLLWHLNKVGLSKISYVQAIDGKAIFFMLPVTLKNVEIPVRCTRPLIFFFLVQLFITSINAQKRWFFFNG